MRIRCLGCAKFVFDVEIRSEDLAAQPVIALTCPNCSAPTSLQRRDGGGVEICLDKHLKDQRAPTK